MNFKKGKKEYKKTDLHMTMRINWILYQSMLLEKKDRVVIQYTYNWTHTTAYLTCCIPEKIDMVQPMMNGLTLNKAIRRPRFCATHIASLHLMISAMSTKHSFVLLLTRIAILSTCPCHMCFSFSTMNDGDASSSFQVSSPITHSTLHKHHHYSIITPIF